MTAPTVAFRKANSLSRWFAALAPVALLAGAYVIFLAFAFHGPSHWQGNQAEFGFFVDHFTFLAGLLFAAVHGPGEKLSMKAGLIWK